MEMDPKIIISIQQALDHLHSCINKYDFENDDEVKAVVYRLRCLRTFVICSTKLGGDAKLISLWGRLDVVVCKIRDDEFSPHSSSCDKERFSANIRPFVEEMDSWFNLKKFTMTVKSHVIKEILGSVIENFNDSLVFYGGYYEDRAHDFFLFMEGLKEYMVFLRNFIGFATFDEHHNEGYLFVEVGALAVSAAHLTVYLFSSEDSDRFGSIASALEYPLRNNPQLCKKFSLALANLKHNLKYSQKYTKTDPHDPINIVMMEFSGYLLSLVKDMREHDAASINPSHDSQLKTLFDGLSSVPTYIEEFPCMFHLSIRDTTRVAISNAGIIIFSFYQRDFAIDLEFQDFVAGIKMIQSKFTERNQNFRDAYVLAFLDSLLDYVKKVNSSKVDSIVLSYVPKIRENIALLISFMGILMELRQHQEVLHQGLWNLGVEVAYKLEFLVDQLVLGNILGSFLQYFESIAAHMRTLKDGALKIFADKGLGTVRDIKMSGRIIMSIQSVLDHLKSCMKRSGVKDIESEKMEPAMAVMCRLRCVRTFVICSTKLGINVELRSLWVRLDDVVRRILDDEFSHDSARDAERFRDNMESLVVEMDTWLTVVSDHCLQQSTLAVAVTVRVLDDLIGSIVENFEDFIRFKSLLDQRDPREEMVESLKEYMVFLRNFIGFATFLCGDQHQEDRNLFTKVEALAVSAAHLTVYIFTFKDDDKFSSIASALRYPLRNPQLCETFSLAVANLKYSRELYTPTLHDPFNIVMMEFIGYLLSLQCEVASFNPSYDSQLKTLFDGLRSLVKFIEEFPRMFHGEIRDTTRVAICNAGVIIFSFHKSDFVIDHELQDFIGNIEMIQSEFDEKHLNFPGTAVLAFLDSLLDYMKKVNRSKFDSSFLSYVPKIRENVAFLISFMGILMELGMHQEDLHQGLWNLGVEVAYKLEFLVDQLVLGNILRSFSQSFESIAEHMRIIKDGALKIFADKGLETVRDIKMAARTINSIQPILDHLHSCMKRNGAKDKKSPIMEAALDVMYRLRCVRTFVICSSKLGINVELRSLWVRLDDAFRRILDDEFSWDSAFKDAERFHDNMESFVKEMDSLLIGLPDYCLQQSSLTVAVTTQVLDDLIDSIVENLEDFIKCCRRKESSEEYMESLKEYMVFLRDFIRFAILLCGDQHQDVQDLFSQIEAVAVSVAHLTLYLFAAEDTNDTMRSISSALQSRITPSNNPQLYETYSRALASIKYSHGPTLHDPMIVMMHFIGHLHSLSVFRNDYYIRCELRELFDGLVSLETFCNQVPSMFHGEIRDITRIAACDAGVIIFKSSSLRYNPMLDDFLGNIKGILSEFEERPDTPELVFLDSIREKCSHVCSNILRAAPTIQIDLNFLSSLIQRLVELRKQQEDLHEDLWILAVQVINNFKILVDQLSEHRVTGDLEDLESFSVSFLSITADMDIIKTKSFKVFHHNTTEEDRDIEMASQRIESIDSAYRHVQSYLGTEASVDKMIVMNRLRCLKTFVICSRKLGNNAWLWTLLARIDNMVRQVLDCEFSDDVADTDFDQLIEGMMQLDEGIDNWFIRLSYYDLQQGSSLAMATRVKDILDSLFLNLEDFQSFPKSKELKDFGDQIDALKVTINLLKNFVTFASHMCADQHQGVRDLFTQIKAFAVKVAHLTVFFYTHHQQISACRMESIISVLQLRIRPFQNLQFYAPTMHTEGDPMMVPIDSLLSLLWIMLLSDVTHVVPSRSQLEKLDLGLRSLKALLRKKPHKFDDRIMDMVRVAICDIGILFSQDPNDSVIDLGLKKFQVILKKVEERVVPATFKFPKTTMLGFLDFLLEYMKEVDSSKFASDKSNNILERIEEDLNSLRSLMENLVGLRDQQGDLHQPLWDLGAATAYKIELLIDHLVLGDIAESFSKSVQSITEDMEIIKNHSVDVQKITSTSSDQAPSQNSTPEVTDFVGFKDEEKSIIERLTGQWESLQVVAIVGMPGLGKTTLATKVYNEPLVVRKFRSSRAWCAVSQVLNKRKVLIELLIQTDQKKPPNEYDHYVEKTYYDLTVELYRSLKDRQYLIFLDDVWDKEAYEWLISEKALPDDSKGSRIILTSRHRDVARDEQVVSLSEFTPEQSLELLRVKVPDWKDWPAEIHDLGKTIAESCKGLPLTIVVVAGLLKNLKHEVWYDVLNSLKSGNISHEDQCVRTMELSYNYLPDHLKPCFLSFAAFPEDHEISAKRLIWMWIAEGFVRKSKELSLEEAARDWLKDLIGRSIVMNAKERSTGGVKSCRMHDLLRDFCVKKANEEHFLRRLEGSEELLSFDDPGNMRRLCILSEPEHLKNLKLYWPRLRSLQFFDLKDRYKVCDMSSLFVIFKLLKVLDMERVYLSFRYPSEIGSLVHLRYLAMVVAPEVDSAIGNLSNLETLILTLGKRKKTRLPATFWNLQKLRHLYSSRGAGICLPDDNLESTGIFLKTDCLSTLVFEDWDTMEPQLKRFPNILRLKCRLLADWNIRVPVVSFSFLKRLESLLLTFYPEPFHDYELNLPNTLKKLTLHGCGLPWSKVAGIAKLPSLEVLKLLSKSFYGGKWEVNEEEFPKLRVLKLSELHIVTWTACEGMLPNLEKLVLDSCDQLKEIPSDCLMAIPKLKLIEVINCSDSTVTSVKDFEEESKGNGYLADLRVDVHSDR